jgi:hypothetical protein
MPENNQDNAVVTESVASDNQTEAVIPNDQAEAETVSVDPTDTVTTDNQAEENTQEDMGVAGNQADTVEGGMSESEA